MTYQLVCGAEIHVELKTNSKMFCGCKNDPFHAPKPNLYTCPVCLGLPGGLPVPNKKAIENTILLGLALHSEIPEHAHFDRKHYFYPDLPKGYQISQKDEPFCIGGYVDTSFGRVRLNHIHLEEDAAKMHHEVVDGKKVSLIDYNRSSVALMEIVTEPDIKSPEQAKEFLKSVRDTVRALGISDCDMEKGSMRLEANISLTTDGSLPPYKVEVKNINSFRFFANALESEMKRQAEILDRGETPVQETRGYRDATKSTVSQRGKEGAADYRYFPDPDIPPITVSRTWVKEIEKRLPELPEDKLSHLTTEGIAEATAKILLANPDMFTFVEQVKKLNNNYFITAANSVVNKKVDHTQVTPEEFIKSLEAASSSKITDETILKPMIEKVIADNPKVVADFKAGKGNAISFLVGGVMKVSGGKADAVSVAKLLQNLLH
jgi:aspartyl-tRNA(Asn)/glutamyl-tRNA(Gln) amidotransferase subunit B